MPIGVGAAMLVGSLAGAGASIASSKMQSGAAKDASRAQTQAAERAAAETRAAQARADAALAPYQQFGQQGMNSMGAMLGQPRPMFQPPGMAPVRPPMGGMPPQGGQGRPMPSQGGRPPMGGVPPDPNAMFAGNAQMGRLAPQQNFGQTFRPR